MRSGYPNQGWQYRLFSSPILPCWHNPTKTSPHLLYYALIWECSLSKAIIAMRDPQYCRTSAALKLKESKSPSNSCRYRCSPYLPYLPNCKKLTDALILKKKPKNVFYKVPMPFIKGLRQKIKTMPAQREIRKLSLGNHEFIGVEISIKVMIFNDLTK